MQWVGVGSILSRVKVQDCRYMSLGILPTFSRPQFPHCLLGCSEDSRGQSICKELDTVSVPKIAIVVITGVCMIQASETVSGQILQK